MSWLPNRLPIACGLAQNDMPACQALAVAWPERGAATLINLEFGMSATTEVPNDFAEVLVILTGSDK